MADSSHFVPSLERHRHFSSVSVGIAVAEWNAEITDKLLEGAYSQLIAQGVFKRHITVCKVPGSFELPLAAQWLAEKQTIDAVIALGCLVKGETPHFEYISESVSAGIKDVALKFNKPVVFGVLTTFTQEQAQERVGGAHGHKGEEAAITALQMLKVKFPLKKIA